MNTSPKVSIGMPVRNGLPYLKEAIESLLAQTYGDFELIISDNASDDGTAEVCAGYARRDSRIRLLRNPENAGAAENYNRVFREARGRYFKWAAADDVCLPGFLESCVEVLERHPRIVLCYPRTQCINERGLPMADGEENLHVDHASAVWRFRYVIRMLNKVNCVFGVLRSDALRQTNLIGAYPGSDNVLIAELAMLGSFHEVPEQLLVRRMHEGQSMRAYTTRRERAQWFHPHQAGGRLFPWWRILGEHIRVISRSPVPFCTRIGCHLQLVPWVHRRRKVLLKEVLSGCLLLPQHLKGLWPSGGGLSVRRGEPVAER